jgi:hypothetical protein
MNHQPSAQKDHDEYDKNRDQDRAKGRQERGEHQEEREQRQKDQKYFFFQTIPQSMNFTHDTVIQQGSLKFKRERMIRHRRKRPIGNPFLPPEWSHMRACGISCWHSPCRQGEFP